MSLLTVMAGAAMSPTLGVISDRYPEADRLLIQMIVSLPALVIIPSLAMTTWLTRRFAHRKVLLAGLLVYIAGGVGGGFTNSIGSLLFFRGLLGLAVGMVMPFSTTLISDFFQGEQRASLLGLSSASNMLGGLFALLVSGLLADISWRLPFGIYIFALPVFILNLIYLPEPPHQDNKTEGDLSLPGLAYLLALGMFFLNLTFYVLPPTIALFIKENSLGNPQMTGVAIAASTAAGFFAGIMLQKTRRITGRFYVSLMLILMCSGFLSLHYAGTILAVLAGNSFIGFANRSLYPVIFYRATHDISGPQLVKITSLLCAMVYLGQFLSPIFITMVGHILGNPSFRFAYLIVALMLLAGSAIFAAIPVYNWIRIHPRQ